MWEKLTQTKDKLKELLIQIVWEWVVSMVAWSVVYSAGLLDAAWTAKGNFGWQDPF